MTNQEPNQKQAERHPLFESPAADATQLPTMVSYPRPQLVELWDPNAAALWCVLFSPAFGAYLHAANWRVLGNPERAKSNMAFFWIIWVALAVMVIGSLMKVDALDALSTPIGIGLLMGWYVSQAKPQIRFVKEHQIQIQKKSFLLPLLVGLGGWVAYFVVITLLVFAFHLQ